MGNYAPRLPVYASSTQFAAIALSDDQWSELECVYRNPLSQGVRDAILAASDRYLSLHEAEANVGHAAGAVAVAKRGAEAVANLAPFACSAMYDGSDESSVVRSLILDRLADTLIEIAPASVHEEVEDGTAKPYFDEGARIRRLALRLDPDVIFNLFQAMTLVAEGAVRDAQDGIEGNGGFGHHAAFFDWAKSIRRILKAEGLPQVPLTHGVATHFSIFMRCLHGMLPPELVEKPAATDYSFAERIKKAGRI